MYKIPAGILKLRIEYGNCDSPYKLYYFVLKAVSSYVNIEDIRRPVIESVVVDGTDFSIKGDKYASLWGIEQKSFEARVLREDEYTPEVSTYLMYGAITEANISVPGSIASVRPLRVQIRYIDVEDTRSRWSEGYIIA